MHLPDINVWLALGFEAHAHHAIAKAWFETLEEGSCAFCRVTQMGFLRLVTNQKAFGTEAVSMRDAWGLYDAFQSDERVGVVREPLQIEDRWRAHTAGGTFSPKVWNDAYLAAFAMEGGLKLVSFDQGFREYEGLDGLILP